MELEAFLLIGMMGRHALLVEFWLCEDVKSSELTSLMWIATG